MACYCGQTLHWEILSSQRQHPLYFPRTKAATAPKRNPQRRPTRLYRSVQQAQAQQGPLTLCGRGPNRANNQRSAHSTAPCAPAYHPPSTHPHNPSAGLLHAFFVWVRFAHSLASALAGCLCLAWGSFASSFSSSCVASHPNFFIDTFKRLPSTRQSFLRPLPSARLPRFSLRSSFLTKGSPTACRRLRLPWPRSLTINRAIITRPTLTRTPATSTSTSTSRPIPSTTTTTTTTTTPPIPLPPQRLPRRPPTTTIARPLQTPRILFLRRRRLRPPPLLLDCYHFISLPTRPPPLRME